MAGRHPDPKSPYRMFPHKSNGYLYGATVRTVYNDQGKRIRKITHWGTLSRELLFTPNVHFMMLKREEIDSFIFPDDWDISLVQNISQAGPQSTDSIETATGLEDGRQKADQTQTEAASEDRSDPGLPSSEQTTSSCTAEGAASAFPGIYQDKLYGAVWFLMQIAELKHVIDDLMVTFEYKTSVVNDILTMAIFPYLTRKNFDRLARDQKIRKYPSDNNLTSSYITSFTQGITPQNRMDFCKLRLKRQPQGAFFACDSTTRSAWGSCIAEIHRGRNKDNKEMNCTLEVVVYSLTTHEPVYYRMFPGNEPDARTLRTINEDLRHLGVTRYVTIFDRGYESSDNINDLFRSDFPFIACSKIAQTPVIDCLMQIQYDQNGLAKNMKYDPEYHQYYAQFKVENWVYTDTDGSEVVVSGEDFKCNVFLNPARRVFELIDIETEISTEYHELETKEKQELLAERGEINKKLRFHRVNYIDNPETKETTIEIAEKPDAIAKEKAQCGFCSSISYKAPGDALEMFKVYKTRDEQEKYFEQMKDQMDFHTQDASSQDGRAGRAFILFVGLILSSTVRNTWRDSVDLRENFTTSLGILDEMEDVRWIQYADGREIMTEFRGLQLPICEAFGISIPQECLPASQRRALERKANPKKRGRKPKGTLAPNKVSVVQC